MVSNSFKPSPSSRAQEALEGAGGRIKELTQPSRDERRPVNREAVRTVFLLAVVAVAGGLLFFIPEPNNDPVAEVFAVGADDPDAPTVDEAPASTFEVSDSAAERSEPGWLVAVSGAEAAAEVTRFASRATTTEAPTTTAAPTTEAPTTAKPTTTAPPTTAATSAATETVESTEASANADESTDTTAASDTTASTEAEQETTTTAPPTTAAPTTEAPTTTAPGNGYVDAGHGVFVPPILLKIRWCESTDNYTAANPASSARGAYQFLTGSWAAYGHASRYGVSQAHLASPAQQDEAALITWERDGTRPWLASKHCWG